MLNRSTTAQLRAFLVTFFLISIASSLPLSADVCLDSGSFSRSEPSGTGFVVATSQFSLTSADIPDVTLETNFTVIDAGIEIIVNGVTLYSTGNDVSNFGPQVFVPTAVQPDNIDFSFSPNDNGLPRMTVVSDSSGSDFSGAAFVNSTTTVEYLPLFNVNNFTSLLTTGNNVIEIVNLNGFQGASLVGDYSVKVASSAIPEPTAFSFCLAGGLFLMSRRRRR